MFCEFPVFLVNHPCKSVTYADKCHAILHNCCFSYSADSRVDTRTITTGRQNSNSLASCYFTHFILLIIVLTNLTLSKYIEVNKMLQISDFVIALCGSLCLLCVFLRFFLLHKYRLLSESKSSTEQEFMITMNRSFFSLVLIM